MQREALLQDIERVIAIYEELIGISAVRTRQMIERYGAIEALSRLAVSGEVQSGFRVLRDRDRLDLTFEAVIKRHADLFREDVVDAAKWRLQNAYLLD